MVVCVCIEGGIGKGCFPGCCRVLMRKSGIFSLFINDLGLNISKVLMKFVSDADLEMFPILRSAEKLQRCPGNNPVFPAYLPYRNSVELGRYFPKQIFQQSVCRYLPIAELKTWVGQMFTVALFQTVKTRDNSDVFELRMAT